MQSFKVHADHLCSADALLKSAANASTKFQDRRRPLPHKFLSFTRQLTRHSKSIDVLAQLHPFVPAVWGSVRLILDVSTYSAYLPTLYPTSHPTGPTTFLGRYLPKLTRRLRSSTMKKQHPIFWWKAFTKSRFTLIDGNRLLRFSPRAKQFARRWLICTKLCWTFWLQQLCTCRKRAGVWPAPPPSTHALNPQLEVARSLTSAPFTIFRATRQVLLIFRRRQVQG